MSEAATAEAPRAERYANLMFVAAAFVVLSLLFGVPRLRLWLSLLMGWFGSGVVLHFARAYRRAAQSALSRGSHVRGRIVERRASDGSLSFVMPAAGTEPWLVDAVIVWVATAAAVAAGSLLDTGDRGLLGFLAALLVMMGFRLASAPSDRLRLELSAKGWSVDALSGGRGVHRSGPGPLLPELLPDALVLWSLDGRVGVLRGELLPEERAWLSERLTALAEDSAVAAEANHEFDQRDSDDHGQEQQT